MKRKRSYICAYCGAGPRSFGLVVYYKHFFKKFERAECKRRFLAAVELARNHDRRDDLKPRPS